MFAYIMNANMVSTNIIDEFESFIWTDRYNGAGEFEIVAPVDRVPLSDISIGNYLFSKDSDRLMIIEDISIDTDPEAGNHVTITGRSIESLLERRVISPRLALTGNLQNCIKKILDTTVINPSNANRKFQNFQFRASEDSRITEMTVDVQFLGETVYDAIYGLCDQNQLGFRILPDFESDGGGFIFELYLGKDRSWAQDENPWVVFSTKYENLLDSNYYESSRNFRTVCFASADSNSGNPRIVECTDEDGGGTGLDRREMFSETNVQEVTVTYIDEEGNEQELTDYAEWDKQIKNAGNEELAATSITATFEGSIEARQQFAYGKDFYIGDVVQVVNEYGIEAKSRITELVRTHDTTQDTLFPTFSAIEQTYDPGFVGKKADKG